MFEDVVVIIGAGALGLYALQLARLAGPQRIIVLGRRPDRLAVAREWADDVIDVTETRGNEAVMRLTGGQGANVVIEATGDPSGAADALAIAGRAARVALLGIFDQPAPMLMDVVGRHEISLYGTRGYSHKEFMQALSMLMGGHVRHTPIITHTLPLTEFEQGLALIAQREAIRVHLSA